MNSETVAAIIFILLAGNAAWAILWNNERKKTQFAEEQLVNLRARTNQDAAEVLKHSYELEKEIVRLRTIPLTPAPEKHDTSIIRAKSAAQVRQITEATWGIMPELEKYDS